MDCRDSTNRPGSKAFIRTFRAASDRTERSTASSFDFCLAKSQEKNGKKRFVYASFRLIAALRQLSSIKQKRQHQRADYDAIPGERRKPMTSDEADGGLDDEQRRQESGGEADGDQ